MAFDVRLYRFVLLLVGVATLAVVIPSNLFLSLPAAVNLTSGGLGLASFAFYALSRRGRNLFATYCLLMLVGFNVIWFFNYGSEGSVIYWFFVGGGVVTVLLRGWRRSVGLTLLAADGVALLLVDALYPSLSNAYTSPAERTLDLVTGFLAALVTGLVAARETVDAFRRETVRLARANAALELSLAEVRTLRGLLPICGWCKKIRDDDGAWTAIERYLAAHAEVVFTHGICPNCVEKHFPEPLPTPPPGPGRTDPGGDDG